MAHYLVFLIIFYLFYRLASQQAQVSCPDAKCVTLGMVTLMLAVQLLVMFAYSLYK